MILKQQYCSVPSAPGIYYFKNSRGVILYIGKAGNLRARLKFYFAKNIPIKTKVLLREATELSWKILGSEIEALIRESELIKKYKPKYNIVMRDDKQYLYVGFSNAKISTEGGPALGWQKIFTTHQTQNTNTQYIGPFTESGSLKSTLKMLRRVFPYCTCKKPHKTPCLNARIGRCLGFCCLDNKANKSSKEDLLANYKNNIVAIKQILTGKNKSLLRSLKKEMLVLSKARRYEEAGKLRNQIYALERIFEHRGVIKKDMCSDRSRALHTLGNILKLKNIARIEGYDISNIHGKYAYGSMVVFSAQGGPASGWVDFGPSQKDYRIFKIRSVAGANDPAMIHEIISRRLKHSEWQYPNVILIDGGPTQLNAAIKAYSSSLGRRTSKLVKIVSLAKCEEALYLSLHQKPIKIKESSESLYSLLTHIRNEAHRFAIKYYRNLH
ncbi:MAG: GIY-YIG nuclease family protein, partial [Patescibacteria group bacterium]